MADKLNIEFALIHRKRDGKALSAPEKMELLVGDVQDKVRHTPPLTVHPVLTLGPYSRWLSLSTTW